VKQLADGVWLLRGFPPNAINVYLVGDVLIDAGTKHSYRRILRQIRGHAVTAHALTHAHPDHQGSSHTVCEALRIPLWCPERDVPAMESGDILGTMADTFVNRLNDRLMTGPLTPWTAPCARATRSPASRCSTRRGTRWARWPSGANPTAR
jgi:glyoxylase-like metal-dependent hydrolase (beta-lactamase superfamily II)